MYIAGTCTSARQLTRESFGRYKVVKKDKKMWRIKVRITVYSVRYPPGALRAGGGGDFALYTVLC